MLKSNLKIVKAMLFNLYRKAAGYPVCINANKADSNQLRKRALLIYLSQPFKFKQSDRRFYLHQNYKQSIQIANILGDLGFIVDVADFRDLRFKPTHYYDILISHRLNLNTLEQHFRRTKLKIYLATGMNPVFQNKYIKDRYRLLEQRRQCSLKQIRLCDTNMSFLKNANAIVMIGNKVIADSWKNGFTKDIYLINNYCFSDIAISPHIISTTTKNNFLYFASSGNVLKGLDWLLEIFPRHPELHLTICGDFLKEDDFLKCYSKELFATRNINPIGWVNLFSNSYKKIIANNTFIIHPSCAEGQPGSVLQCMQAGLIPIVTKNCGIDTEDFGFTLNEDSLEELEKLIKRVTNLSILELQELQQKMLIALKIKFSESAFIVNWTNILTIITKALHD